jgi:hypothetical protein
MSIKIVRLVTKSGLDFKVGDPHPLIDIDGVVVTSIFHKTHGKSGNPMEPNYVVTFDAINEGKIEAVIPHSAVDCFFNLRDGKDDSDPEEEIDGARIFDKRAEEG